MSPTASFLEQYLLLKTIDQQFEDWSYDIIKTVCDTITRSGELGSKNPVYLSSRHLELATMVSNTLATAGAEMPVLSRSTLQHEWARYGKVGLTLYFYISCFQALQKALRARRSKPGDISHSRILTCSKRRRNIHSTAAC
nr:hypothetical protein CFP56_21985 [Quercus suber]